MKKLVLAIVALVAMNSIHAAPMRSFLTGLGIFGSYWLGYNKAEVDQCDRAMSISARLRKECDAPYSMNGQAHGAFLVGVALEQHRYDRVARHYDALRATLDSQAFRATLLEVLS